MTFLQGFSKLVDPNIQIILSSNLSCCHMHPAGASVFCTHSQVWRALSRVVITLDRSSSRDRDTQLSARPVWLQVASQPRAADVQAFRACTSSHIHDAPHKRLLTEAAATAAASFVVRAVQCAAVERAAAADTKPPVLCSNPICTVTQSRLHRFRKCAKCRTDAVRYCSRCCQVAAWQGHRPSCGKALVAAGSGDAGAAALRAHYMGAMIRRLLEQHLPVIRHGLLKGSAPVTQGVVWISALSTPCDVKFVTVEQAFELCKTRVCARFTAATCCMNAQVKTVTALLTAYADAAAEGEAEAQWAPAVLSMDLGLACVMRSPVDLQGIGEEWAIVRAETPQKRRAYLAKLNVDVTRAEIDAALKPKGSLA